MKRTVLFVALALLVGSGTTAAASKLITGKQIKNGSITKVDLAKSARPKNGTTGRTGPPGPAGAPAGAAVTNVSTPQYTLLPGQSTVDAAGVGGFRASCPAGYVVVGTGFDAGIGNVDYVESFGTFVGGFINNDTSIAFQVELQAICAPAPGTPYRLFSDDAESRARRMETAAQAQTERNG